MRNFTLADLLQRNARLYGAETALIWGESRISFAELLKRSRVEAAALAGKGIGQGDRIAILAMNHPGYFSILGAAALLGAILVPLNWRLANQELHYILTDCTPRVLFADEHFLAQAKDLAQPLALAVHPLPGGDTGPVGDTDCGTSGSSPTSADDPCCILYTAAVDGHPRGAVLSHHNLLSANLQVITAMGLTSADVYLAMLPLFHITGLNLALAVMQMGGASVILEKFSEDAALTSTAAENVTLWGSFPPMLQRITAALLPGSKALTSLKQVVGLDSPANITAFEEQTAARFWILYGQAETTGFVTFGPAAERLGTAGRQCLLSTFMLVDENGREVATGETGEIVVRGPLVFQGYWQRDEINRHTFRHGWHHTGDLGQIDSDGYLIFKGRKPEKELIKPGGENVYPAEVEKVILEHPAVAAVSVIGVADPKFGEGVKAVCVLKPGAALTAEELIVFVGARIARYKKPGYVEFVATLPMIGGSIDRSRVKELYGGM